MVAFLSRWIPRDGAVLEVACDRGYFIRNVHAQERWATDIRDMSTALDGSVNFVQADGLALASVLPASHFDVAFMSNYLEHLPSSDAVLQRVIPRLLPYTTKSRLPQHPLLVRAHPSFPLAWRVMGKQTLMVAMRPDDGSL